MENRPTGPNVKKLMTRKMAVQMIPDGGGFAAGLEALSNPASITDHARRALEWAFDAIDAVKAAPDNEWGDDDEVIAGVILEQINARQ